MDLREKIARIITTEYYGKWTDDRLEPTSASWAAADRILAIPEIAIALAAQMPDLPPERVGEIMRGMGETGLPGFGPSEVKAVLGNKAKL